MAYVRTVKTASGATAVQLVDANRRGSDDIGTSLCAPPAEIEVLKMVAQQRLHTNQDTLDFGDGQLGDAEAPIVASQARHLWETLMTAHGLPEVTVVADAGMMSEANLKEIEDAGLRFIVGARIPDVPYQVKKWRQDHPDEPLADGQILVQPTVMGPKTDQRRRTIFYQYRQGRAKRTLQGIDTQIAKAEKAIKGQAAVKRNRFVQLTGGTKTINRELEAKTRALAGLKGYITNLQAPTPDYVLGAYHQLWQIEKSFRMSKSDLRARPIYHHKRESIEAHLTIVMAALAVSHWLEHVTDTSIKKIVQTLRRHRSIAVQTGDHILHASTPLDDDARAIVSAVKAAVAAH